MTYEECIARAKRAERRRQEALDQYRVEYGVIAEHLEQCAPIKPGEIIVFLGTVWDRQHAGKKVFVDSIHLRPTPFGRGAWELEVTVYPLKKDGTPAVQPKLHMHLPCPKVPEAGGE